MIVQEKVISAKNFLLSEDLTSFWKYVCTFLLISNCVIIRKEIVLKQWTSKQNPLS